MKKSILTFSALNTFRNCPRKYKLRNIDGLRRREKPESLTFGSVIHEALQKWYTLPPDENRLFKVLDHIDAQFPGRGGDAQQKFLWQLARAMMCGYAARYREEEFTAVEIEKEFQAEIRNPETGRASQTFSIAGKVDGIVKIMNELYLLEHKTAATLDGNYLDKLWTDTQIALYCYYLRQIGYPIVGVIYNVLLKSRLEQRAAPRWPRRTNPAKPTSMRSTAFSTKADLPHGKGWAFVKNEWHRVLTKLASLPYGLILISHAVDKTIETRTGEMTKTQPSLPDRARAVVLGLVDMILYCDATVVRDKDGNMTTQRIIRTKPHPTYEAGDRTGRLPETLPLNYDAFVNAFNSNLPAKLPSAK